MIHALESKFSEVLAAHQPDYATRRCTGANGSPNFCPWRPERGDGGESLRAAHQEHQAEVLAQLADACETALRDRMVSAIEGAVPTVSGEPTRLQEALASAARGALLSAACVVREAR